MMERITNLLTKTDEGHMFDETGMMFGGDWFMLLMMMSGILIVVFLTVWTYQDAVGIGENAILWSLVVFLTMGLGIIVYALIRSPNRDVRTADTKPIERDTQTKIKSETVFAPQKPIENTTLYCENCGAELGPYDKFCHKCGSKTI
ncbi:MAG: zinc ribbon domain-containing protein [Candidatus Hodarchaeales archaeon]